MLDLKFIRENPELVKDGLQRKKTAVDLERILSLDARRREILGEVEAQKHRRNVVSEEIAKLKKEKQDASALIQEMQDVGRRIKGMDDEVKQIEEDLNGLLLTIPNLPHESVPEGDDASANAIVREWGKAPLFDFEPKSHLEIGERLDILDFKRGAKIAGSGFPLYKGLGAKLERALINFMLDLHVEKHGYRETFPPFLANPASMQGTGQLPKMAEDMYFCNEDDLYLIPTAEVPITNIHRNEILDGSELPIYYTGYSACFRREAGSYGKETKGFLRVHQFNKVEMVKLVNPDTSYDELESLVRDAEEVLQLLELPYRVMLLCAGDLSFAAAKCYDIEIWAAGEKKYLEVSSCSNFEDFQARRIPIRFRREKGAKPEYIHTLNGSGVATARLMVAILEQYQTDEGTVAVPDVLRKYVGTNVIR